MTDEIGEVVWEASYRAWGEARETIARVSKAAGVEPRNPIRFQGQQEDAETGLRYNRYRYYDPGSGRFVPKDPIGLDGGINVYRYAPNPVGWTDPLGLAGRPLSGNDATGRPLASPHYSVWTQKKMPCEIWNGSREDHFRFANEQLHNQLKDDPALAAALGPDVVDHVAPGSRGGFSDRSPPILTWRHSAQEPDTLELILRRQHKYPGSVQGTLHPNQ